MTQPGLGGKLGKAKDFWDWMQSGGNLWNQSRPDEKRAKDLEAAGTADPPDAAVSAVALPRIAHPPPLRPCVRFTTAAAAGSFADCVSLTPSLVLYGQTEAQTSAVLDAVLTSQNRYATAVRAGEAGPSAVQHVVTGILYVELGDALAATDQAGLAVARIGRAQGLFPVLTRHQIEQLARSFAHVRRLPAAVTRALPGVTRAEIARALSDALRKFNGSRVDLVSTFAHPFHAAALIPPAGWVTAGAVQAVVARLIAQGEVPAASGVLLDQALNDLEIASGRAAVQHALSELTIAAERVPGPAGAFLQAGERALARGA
jgi:hypothetical protein